MSSVPGPYEMPAEVEATPMSAVVLSWGLASVSVVALVGLPALGILLLNYQDWFDQWGLLLVLAGPPLAIPFGLAAVVPAWIARRSLQGILGGLLGLFSAGSAGLVTAGFGYFMLFARGRQLREGGELKLPPVARGEAWAARGTAILVPEPVRAGVAAAWRENGRTEHASVAAFARVSLELIGLGAPPELLVDAARDAVDEIWHTEACFRLARAIDGEALSPGAFPEATTAGALKGERPQRLVELAVTSLVDGALHEGVSARVLTVLAQRCVFPEIVEVLQALAKDEERHAAHAWDVVSFCVDEGGEAVREALRDAALRISEEIRTPHPDGALQGGWERYGIPGRALEQEEYSAALAALRQELGRRLAVAQAA